MKSGYLLAPLALAMALATVPVASAQNYPPPPPPQHAPMPVSFGYASVLRVTPVYENYHTMEQQCDGPPQEKDTTGGTVLGAIVGGVLGNTIGRNSNHGGRVAATAAGAIAGGAIGNSIARNSDSGPPGCRMVDVVHNDNTRPAGFDVEYDYKGEVYVARMPYDPGNRIRVRVSVVPADEGPGSEGPPPYGR